MNKIPKLLLVFIFMSLFGCKKHFEIDVKSIEVSHIENKGKYLVTEFETKECFEKEDKQNWQFRCPFPFIDEEIIVDRTDLFLGYIVNKGNLSKTIIQEDLYDENGCNKNTNTYQAILYRDFSEKDDFSKLRFDKLGCYVIGINMFDYSPRISNNISIPKEILIEIGLIE